MCGGTRWRLATAMPAALLPLALVTRTTRAQAQDDDSAEEDFALPPYMSPMPTTDPLYPSLNESGTDYALGSPGDGGVTSYKVAILEEAHDVYRLWGGPAEECGYWWTMSPNDDVVPSDITLSEEEHDYAGTCPSWNNGTNVTRCTLPIGTAVVVGPGQSVTCPTGEELVPKPYPLSLNGDVCGMTNVTCVSCETGTTIEPDCVIFAPDPAPASSQAPAPSSEAFSVCRPSSLDAALLLVLFAALRR